ncbi:MAG: Tm-1-like ATP-binding domain-containing protein [Isosphaeraceae bacterium]
MAVVIVGTLDTKGHEIAFARDVLNAEGLDVVVVDAGSLGEPVFQPEIGRDVVFRAAGTSLDEVRAQNDRGAAVTAAARGAAAVIDDLHQARKIEGILGLGGSAGTVIGTSAMRQLPFGLPKVMLSTLASGQTRHYVGGSDILMFASVADLSGLNRLTRTVITNAARALAGMARPRCASFATEPSDRSQERPLVAATMFGVTTPCVDRARQRLEVAGLEVVVFHATGVGGQAMEGLVRDGLVVGLLDLTTTELADELVGGVLSAGPARLEAAVRARIPQVLSVGALDMVNFGPLDTIPERFRGREFHVHNPSVTLMRTTPEENRRLGEWIVRILGQSRVPGQVMLPLRGVSALDAPGKPFHDPNADAVLFDVIRSGLADHPHIRVVERDEHINDPAFADAAASNLLELLGRTHARA